jgi:hypothetical protein
MVQDNSGKWLVRRGAITKRYLYGWFPIDIVSLAPSSADYIDLVRVLEGREAGDSTVASLASVLRVTRAVRLLKLLRLLRTSRVFTRMLNRIAIPYFSLSMLKLSTLVTLSARTSAPSSSSSACLRLPPLAAAPRCALEMRSRRARPTHALLLRHVHASAHAWALRCMPTSRIAQTGWRVRWARSVSSRRRRVWTRSSRRTAIAGL